MIPEVAERLETNDLSPAEFSEQLINKSVGNYLTVFYDQLQYFQNGYYH